MAEHRPLMLSDDELSAVLCAARPIAVDRRDEVFARAGVVVAGQWPTRAGRAAPGHRRDSAPLFRPARPMTAGRLSGMRSWPASRGRYERAARGANRPS